MKYIVLLGDGMADRPLDDHAGKTPLQISRTPCMDYLAGSGTLGMVCTIPEGFEPGSDVANMCVLGYDPRLHYTGRAPIEAVSMGVSLDAGDIAFRCNLVSLAGNGPEASIDDYSAGHITTAEAHRFIAALKSELDSDACKLHPGISYRHLMVWKGADPRIKTSAPHDITGRAIEAYMPAGPGAEPVREAMLRSRRLFENHPLNRERIAQGKKPVSSIWLWGQGTAVTLPSFREKYGLSGSVISAVDLIKGLGISAGLHSINVPGATGYLDTNYAGKVAAALGALKEQDFVYLHVEAPDEAGHKGSFPEKIQAIEDFDTKIVQQVVDGLRTAGEPFRILLLPDHPTPLCLKTHSSDPVPFVLYDSACAPEHPQKQTYCEADARACGLLIEQGWTLMDRFINGI
ncbi:MAG: cofactor-independent phosphoglycerate mutase [Deltaproteobacteria bacterium]|nr:cofactor-independent phosphoglycerate mutase [Deltaproteobacteria bacterium]